MQEKSPTANNEAKNSIQDNSTTTPTLLDSAIAYAAKGCHVLPCKKDKAPFTSNGFKKATTDEQTLRKWWQTWPHANIGLALAESGLLVIDLDRHPDKPDGVAQFEALRGENEMPQTVMANTGGNGIHLIFKAPNADVKGKIAPGIDVKTNGYIIVAPSVHECGNTYQWEPGRSLLDMEPMDCPEWLLRLIVKDEQAETKTSLDTAPQGRYPESHGDAIIQRCAFIRHWADDAVSLSEPDWYHGLGVLAYTVESSDIVHQYSADYPGYSLEETRDKLSHWKEDGKGPPTCKTIQTKCDDQYCASCPYKGHIKSPIVLGCATHAPVTVSERVPFPVEALPGVFREHAATVAQAIQCPVDYVGCALLAVASILIGDKRRIQLTPEWVQSGNLWIALVGTPSAKKSPALDKALKVLQKIEKELHGQYQTAMTFYETALDQYEQAKKAKSKPNRDTPPEKPIKPVHQRLTTSDITVEALGELLAANPHGLGLVCDELSVWMRSMNQYKGGRGADRSHYLSMWSNAQMTIDRKGKDPVLVSHPFLSIVGGIQPDVLLEMSNNGVEDGTKERFLFSCPYPNRETPNLNVAVPLDIQERCEKSQRTLFENRPCKTLILSLSQGAQQAFQEALTEWHTLVQSEDFPGEMEAYYSKMGNYLGRLALILHEMKRADNLHTTDAVSETTMCEAKQLTDYFLNHAAYALGMVSQTKEDQKAQKALNWIHKRSLVAVSPRDLVTGKVAGCKKATQAKGLLKSLADYGHGIWSEESNRLIILQDYVSTSAKPPKAKH